MASTRKRIQTYHSSFSGDTYDACRRCGGRCEQYKLSTLIPGEKAFIASHLGMTVTRFEEAYLDRIDTPFGCVDVLKLKDRCPFLDGTLRCTVVKAKPILCDSYPIVLHASGSVVRFAIDRRDCPMVRWPEYSACVRHFERNGISAMRRLKVPATWRKMVALYDEFDFDGARLENDLRSTPGNETFMLEEILGYACNGHERRARRRGLTLLLARLKKETSDSLARMRSPRRAGRMFSTRLSRAHRAMLSGMSRGMRDLLTAARDDVGLLVEPSARQYRFLVIETREVIGRLRRSRGDRSERG